MDIINALATSIALSIAFMSGVFFTARSIKRYDVIDMAWGIVFILIAVATLLQYALFHDGNVHWGKLLVVCLVAVWGSRLATHMGHRIKRTTTEDQRYVDLRSQWKGNIEQTIYMRIYMAQALLAAIISLPVIVLNSSQEIVVPAFLLAGAIVWLVGFLIESAADLQLESFVVSHPGKLMKKGLWKYSRHPNYFGELMQWWGIGVMALSVDYGWISLIGPIVLTFLLLYVSGVPLAEKRSEKRDGWAEYKRRTSTIIPVPPMKQ